MITVYMMAGALIGIVVRHLVNFIVWAKHSFLLIQIFHSFAIQVQIGNNNILSSFLNNYTGKGQEYFETRIFNCK